MPAKLSSSTRRSAPAPPLTRPASRPAQEFDLLDLSGPPSASEDKMARIMARASAGLYDGRQADFASEAAATEITLATAVRALRAC